jgi:ligand-binding sensor protein
MLQKDWDLDQLVNLEEWQKTQDSLSEVLEMTLKTVSTDGVMLITPSRPARLCGEILPKIPFFSKFCANCVPGETIPKQLDIYKVTNFKCPFDLEGFVVPIKAVGQKVVAYVIMGPLILKTRKPTSEYVNDAAAAGIKADELIDALIEINVFSYSKVYSVSRLIENIFCHMAQTGYHKRRLGEIAPEVVEMDPLFSHYYEEKILNALLSSCAVALDADSGSVMTLDKKTNRLHIKVASKLDEKIVNNTNVKMGEGIAGLAAATAQPIILPKDEAKNGLAEKMKRKYIKSSMIIPFNKGDSNGVYGVINLNVTRKTVDFSEKDIALVKELVNLTSIALIPFQEQPSFRQSD